MIAVCRICSCTPADHAWCDLVLENCTCEMVEPDLCLLCVVFSPVEESDADRARRLARHFYNWARRRSGIAPGFMQMSDHAEKLFLKSVQLRCTKIEKI